MRTKRVSRRVFLQAGASLILGAGLATPMAGRAQPAPLFTRTLRLIVPNPPGGLADTIARHLAQGLSSRVGQQVVVENRPGGNGSTAAVAMAAARADPHVLLVTDSSMFSVNPLIYKTISYDAKKDFLPVSVVAQAPLFLAANRNVSADNLQALVALMRSKPGKLTYGSSGIGSTHHLTMEAFKGALGLDLLHVPFKGTGESVPALIGGQIDLVFSALPSLSGYVKKGAVKLLAVNSLGRSSFAPEIPAISELVPGFDFAPGMGVWASAGTPPEAIQRLSQEIAMVARSSEFAQAVQVLAINPLGSTPEEYAKILSEDIVRSIAAIRAANIRPE